MSAIQLSFGMRTSAGVKTIHLAGSWDNYVGQLPLAKDKSSSKAGSWKGTFRFQGNTLQQGQRYWYYYIIDGYNVTHDPSENHVVEPTTGRKLNVLDVPSDSPPSKSKSSSKSSSSSSKHSSSKDKDKHSRDKDSKSSKHSRRDRESTGLSLDIPKGRPVSVSQIKSPKPISPSAANFLLQQSYNPQTVEELTSRFAATAFEEDYYSSSPPSSASSSLSSRSGSSSAMSSASSYTEYGSSDGASPVGCTCERYGITRAGERIKLDCGGSRCGYMDDGSSCCSSDDSQEYPPAHRSSRRHVRVGR